MLEPENILPRVGQITPAAVRPASFRIIDRMQHLDPAVQLTATAVALCAICDELGIDMRDVITVAENTLRDCEGPYTEHVQAIRAYARHEILRGGV